MQLSCIIKISKRYINPLRSKNDVLSMHSVLRYLCRNLSFQVDPAVIEVSVVSLAHNHASLYFTEPGDKRLITFRRNGCFAQRRLCGGAIEFNILRIRNLCLMFRRNNRYFGVDIGTTFQTNRNVGTAARWNHLGPSVSTVHE